MKYYTASEREISEGEATDVYFVRTREIIERKGLTNVKVKMELHSYSLPRGYEWAVFVGLEESLKLLEGKPVDVWAIPEGTLFKPFMPVMRVEGPYYTISVYETPLLGIVRHATSIATKAARVKRLAGDRIVLFFGLRALHPAIYPMADRAAYIGGCDGVSGWLSKKYLGIEPKGTMPHALIIVFGDPREAWKAFDEVMPDNIPRIALCDTFYDERLEALMAAETLKDRLFGIRFDTPSSRRGDMRKIVLEAKWTLEIHGYRDVKIFVSGGIDEREIVELRDIVDGFGVGTAIAFPKSVDISMDVVEVCKGREWKPIAKRGKMPGAKQVYRCPNHIGEIEIRPWNSKPPLCRRCGVPMIPLMKKYIENGKIIEKLPGINEIREYVLNQIFKLPEPQPV